MEAFPKQSASNKNVLAWPRYILAWAIWAMGGKVSETCSFETHCNESSPPSKRRAPASYSALKKNVSRAHNVIFVTH